ncbi:ATP-binding protein [Kribbella sp. NPDC051718]|uniref:ATP-binding protein n=1 Tax=Kribbella sp. NPDC051718 TaxID=3155168 RepID=UPI003416C199
MIEGVVPAVRVSGDADKLSQVIRNLADNADNADNAVRSTVRFTLAESSETVTVEVEDDGDGIPPGARARVFERFVRLDASRDPSSAVPGSGCRLSRRLCTDTAAPSRLGESSLGGARCVVRLPVRGPAAGPNLA